ncbi:hypothetical protein Dimus_028619, partial [Dionaea muscipula]
MVRRKEKKKQKLALETADPLWRTMDRQWRSMLLALGRKLACDDFDSDLGARFLVLDFVCSILCVRNYPPRLICSGAHPLRRHCCRLPPIDNALAFFD